MLGDWLTVQSTGLATQSGQKDFLDSDTGTDSRSRFRLRVVSRVTEEIPSFLTEDFTAVKPYGRDKPGIELNP